MEGQMGWNFVLQDCHLKACSLRSFSGARPPEEHQVAGPQEFPRWGERQKVGVGVQDNRLRG